jgi:hypothetical protein
MNPSLNPHEAPPVDLKDIFKKHQKAKLLDCEADPNILDFNKTPLPLGIKLKETISSSKLAPIFHHFAPEDDHSCHGRDGSPVYCHDALPGKWFISPSASDYHCGLL